ncbi:EAL domain-containing protein [Acinetobacter indicus]|uniref:EAL domain-containing protein n=1 Tax=Acinetobacter indicus TaxID=756892 RepID=UPI002097D8BC|nr:EAL domain-containing protein [Acinetobacter indicus]MCO8108624.1 EAL domain-containing protein [Acinetobacter indicus]
MSDHQDELMEQYLYAAQITNTIRLMRFFLLSILILCFYIYFIFHYSFNFSTFAFNAWFLLSELGLAGCLFFNEMRFKPGQYSIQMAHRWIKLVCLLVGISLGIGIALLYYFLPKYSPDMSTYQAIILAALLVIISQTFALTFLTQRLSYFSLVFIPAIVPYLISPLFFNSNTEPLFYLATNFALICLLICANTSMHMHRRLSSVYFKNNQLKKQAEQQVAWTDQLCQQLQTEMNRSKDIEQQLQFNNQMLEQKVKERTFDLEQIHKALQDQQANLVLAHEVAGLKPWDWDIKHRLITLTNEHQQLKMSDSKAHHHKLQQLIHPDDLAHFRNTMKQHLRGQTDRYEVTYRVQQSNGKWVWVHDVGRVIERDPETRRPLRMVGIRRDIHQEKTDQERLKLTASVLQQAAEGIFILNEDLRYIEVNPCFEQLTGFSREQIIGKHLFDIASNYKSRQRSMHNAIVKQLLKEGEYDGEMDEKYLSGKELTIRLHMNTVSNEQNRSTHYVGIVSDLTERRRQEQRLSYLENYDTLTDLPNRFYYNYQLHQYLVSHQDSIKQLAVIRLNIDRFRVLNEYLSHNGGDELLRQVAQRLRLINAEALLVAHLNGDDFAIIYELSHIRPSVQQHCERITKAFSAPFNIQGQDHIITLSMGVSLYPEHGRQLDYLNNCAEQALSEAKRLGGNTTKYYSLETTKLLEQDVHIERDLRQAIKNDELIVYYQPKINFHDQQVSGFEALVRWNHPEKGLIPPGLFIPIAEQTSLISEIGHIVIQQTAKQIRDWQALGFDNIRVSVNIVAQQLQRGHLLEDIDEALNTYHISGESLELEITESSLLENTDEVKYILEEIKKRHIHISLDDFGTGYSSLSYLTDFPIDVLKIDRSFVSKIGHSKQEAIVSAMIAMGKAMGMTIVAEGIETEHQLQYLRKLDCDIAQGFLFSKPLPQQDATRFLSEKMQTPLIVSES